MLQICCEKGDKVMEEGRHQAFKFGSEVVYL